ncbi:MAG TPA: hypothetical protein DEB24_08425 [Coriobacteriia bacterium]|nr:hypothetical protein [Coriobacteriia bacterium]
MRKLGAFLRLELKTIAEQTTPLYIALYLIALLLFVLTTQSVWMGVVVGILSAVTLVNYLFHVSEKNNMDALYPLLGLSRKDVVCGRCIFGFLLTVVVVTIVSFASFLLVAALDAMLPGLREMAEIDFSVPYASQLLFLLTTVVVTMGVLQLPIYFKMGYSRAKNIAIIIPSIIVLIFAGFMGFVMGANSVGDKLAAVNAFLDSPVFIVMCIAVLVFAALVSYRLSLKFYQSRDF